MLGLEGTFPSRLQISLLQTDTIFGVNMHTWDKDINHHIIFNCLSFLFAADRLLFTSYSYFKCNYPCDIDGMQNMSECKGSDNIRYWVRVFKVISVFLLYTNPLGSIIIYYSKHRDKVFLVLTGTYRLLLSQWDTEYVSIELQEDEKKPKQKQNNKNPKKLKPSIDLPLNFKVTKWN